MAMETTKAADVRIRARYSALSLLNNLTAGIAFAAVAGVGIFGTISALTIPGVSASSGSTASAATASSSSSSSTSTSSSSSNSLSNGLQPSTGTEQSASRSGVAVSGGP